MILIIDNYDSFVYNLARYFALAGWVCKVVRNDEITVSDILKLNPAAIVLSPGPCAPAEAGICVEAVKRLGSLIPVLGVCLGHQAIGEAYGAQTVRAKRPVHGRASVIIHEGIGLFAGLPSPMRVGRYHSLTTEILNGGSLRVSARTEAGEVMAFYHEAYPVYGVQFHPESILTEHGCSLIKSFSNLAIDWNKRHRAASQNFFRAA